jgi:hypothetical protein
MSLEVKQETRDKGNGWWAWSLWLEGKKTELDPIKAVTYTLHPTFRDPVRTIRTRNNGFRLDSSGWGMFTVKLDVQYKNGKSVTRRHELKFGEGKRPFRPRRPVVFVSSSAADTPMAAVVVNELQAHKITALDASSVEPSASLGASLRKSFERSDAAIAIISDSSSHWQNAELELATKLKVPIYSILVGENTTVPPSVRTANAVRVVRLEDASKVINEFIAHLDVAKK